MLIFDAHLDLAMNALIWNRDLTRSIEAIRDAESGMTDKRGRGRATVSLPEMRRAGVGLCVATQIAHCVAADNPALPRWSSPEIAWAQTQAQLAWYRVMEEAGWMKQITHLEALKAHARLWQDEPAEVPIGYILSLEGADSVVNLKYLEKAYQQGLRAVGPAHFGAGRYSDGTGSEGGLTPLGRQLLSEMNRLGMILDVTHLSDRAFWEALELHSGAVWASHNNCRALVPHQRQLSDEQIEFLIERDAVIGVVFDAWMLEPEWVRDRSIPAASGLTLERVVDHIDHICQLAGNARHCGIGSDLDGGFGYEQTPADVKSIADLVKLTGALRKRGYAEEDIAGILHGNWLRLLEKAWGEA